MRGAGGSRGGTITFFIGLFMMITGGYLLLEAIKVHSNFHWGYAFYHVGGVGVTSGMILIPFIFGIGFIFYNAKNVVGWILAVGSLGALIFGVISGLQFRMQHMSAFSLLVILVLLVGGIGLFLSSLREFKDKSEA